MRMRKNLLAGLLLLALTGLLVAGSTMSWFVSSPSPKVNTFTAGTVKIEVQEDFSSPAEWDGSSVGKTVQVKSLGSKRTYVRVALTPVWSDPSLPVDNVQLNLADSDWIKVGDWYYYKHILAGGDETSVLLASVELSSAGPEYDGKTLEIVVSAEAVQASHEAYKTVWGLSGLPGDVESWQ